MRRLPITPTRLSVHCSPMPDSPSCVIDIGSNTVRMLVARVRHGGVERLCYRQTTTRLARGLSHSGHLDQGRVAATLSAIREYLVQAASFDVGLTLLIATEAVRAAANGKDFERQLRSLAGVTVRILDWRTEARLSCLGALHSIVPSQTDSLFFDLGGGSLELAIARGPEMQHAISLPLGVVRLAEAPDMSSQVRARVYRALERLGSAHCVDRLVGAAGTVTTLAAIHLGMRVYEPGRINGTILDRKSLTSIRNRLAPLSPAEREAIPGMEPGRGDLILPGLDLVLELMDLSGFDNLTVADGGLLEGALLDATLFH